jgi:DNA-binding response OmpR family regulator
VKEEIQKTGLYGSSAGSGHVLVITPCDVTGHHVTRALEEVRIRVQRASGSDEFLDCSDRNSFAVPRLVFLDLDLAETRDGILELLRRRFPAAFFIALGSGEECSHQVRGLGALLLKRSVEPSKMASLAVRPL